MAKKAEFRFFPTGKKKNKDGQLINIPKKFFEWWRETKDTDGIVVHRQLIGQYWPNMGYNCTSKPVHDALRAMCKDWEEKGMITIVPLSEGQKFISTKVGKG